MTDITEECRAAFYREKANESGLTEKMAKDMLENSGEWVQNELKGFALAWQAREEEVQAMDELITASNALVQIIEGVQGLHFDSFRASSNGARLKDTNEWVSFYNAANKAKRIREEAK